MEPAVSVDVTVFQTQAMKKITFICYHYVYASVWKSIGLLCKYGFNSKLYKQRCQVVFSPIQTLTVSVKFTIIYIALLLQKTFDIDSCTCLGSRETHFDSIEPRESLGVKRFRIFATKTCKEYKNPQILTIYYSELNISVTPNTELQNWYIYIF